MNKKSYKLIFSRRLNKIIAVGENASSVSHSGTRNQSKRGIVSHISYVARLSVCSFAALIALDGYGSAFAAPAVNALPTGASVAAGKVAISQSGNTLTVNQTTNQAVVNWNSFNIGANAKVVINQPSASSVQLDRVTGNNASQIFGQLTSNGQVILVNPNGIVFGKDGSVSASSFTASTLGISDADFLAGNYRYTRNGSTGAIENNGTLQSSSGGYVALLGAQVTNNGKIIAPQGAAYLGAAEAITVPLSSSGKIKLELSPAAINTAVTNSSTGTIVAEGGQVFLQASALNDVAATAVSSVTNSGAIDVSGAQAGNVSLLSDHGNIKVDGSITANSTDTNNKGGNIIIGRDTDTGILSATSDVSGATLQAKGGFIETSGEYLKTDGVKIAAKDWLLDPNNVEINATSTANTAGDSVVKAGDISTALGLGTSVTIATGASGQNSSATGSGGTGTISQATVGTGNTSDGNILVNSAITSTYNGASAPTLTLTANNGITVGAGIGITGAGTGFNVSMTANGLGTTSQGIILNNAINAGTGTVSLTGTTTNATSNGIAFNNGSGITAGSYTAIGNMNATTGGAESNANGTGVVFRGTSSFTSTGASSITGSTQSGTADGVEFYNATSTTFNAGSGSVVLSSGANNKGVQGIRFGYGGGATMNTSGNVTIGSTGNDYAKLTVQGTINASSGTLSLMGQSNTGDGIYFQDGGGVAPKVIATNAANISVTGVSTNANTGNGIYINGGGVSTQMTTNTGSITMNGTATGSGNSSGITFQTVGATSGVTSTGGGAISLTGTVGTGAGNGVSLYSGISTTGSITVNGTKSGTGYAITSTNPLNGTNITLSATPTVNTGSAIYINGSSTAAAPLINATTGNVLIKTTQGQISIYDGSTTASTPTIKGANVTIDNTGSTNINPTTGAITTPGAGYAQTNRGLLFQDGNSNSGVGGGISATGNINIAAQSNSTSYSAMEVAGPIAATGAVNFYGAQTGSGTNNNGIYLYANANISGSTVAMTGVAGTAGGAGIVVNSNVGIYGNATTGTAVSLSGTANTAGLFGIQTYSGSVIRGYSDIFLKATSAGSGITLSGTITGNNSGTGVANVAVESNGGPIAANGAISANNISLDNTNGSINATTGVITRGAAGLTTSGTVGISAFNLTAVNNINIAGNGGAAAYQGVLLGHSTQGISAGNAINVYGSTGGGHGVSVLNSQITAGGPINITGQQTAADQALHGDLGVIIWQGSTITANGGTYAAGSDAIKIAGTGTRGVVINNASIINNSNGGNTSISGTGGGSANTQLDNGAVITNAVSAGAVIVSASGYDANQVGSTVGAANTTTYGALPVITQNSNAGVVISSQYGNVAPPKIINNGNGDVVIAAGTGFAAGNGLSANITAPTGSVSPALNPVTSAGKVYLYSGSRAATGNLSVLNSGFNNLYLAGSGIAPNAQLNTAYSVGGSVAGSTSSTQVMFREATTAPNIAPLPPLPPLPPNVNPVSPAVIPSSTQSAGLGVSFGPASIEESDICSTKRSCNCDATSTAGVEICYSIDVDGIKPKIQISKLVGGKW